MIYRTILFSLSEGVARLTLNRPDKLNSFTTLMHEELRDALACVQNADGGRALLLTGAGRGFCAGQDLSEGVVAGDGESIDLGASVERFYAPLVLALRRLPLPVVCAVNGVAAGAGANLALACDLVIAKRSACFIQSFARLGLVPDTGGTYFLPRLVGTARATALAMLGEKLPAEKAEQWGLIWRCVDDEVFEIEVEATMARLSAAPTLGLARTKLVLQTSMTATLEEQLVAEGDAMRELGRSEDYREGVAAFLGKREAVFHGL